MKKTSISKIVFATVMALVFMFGATAAATGGVHNQVNLVLEQFEVVEVTSWGPPNFDCGNGGTGTSRCSICNANMTQVWWWGIIRVYCSVTGEYLGWDYGWNVTRICAESC
ncbi:MAG: hypothetical protein FWC95_01095 [Defluviitaleaceae bacterium]|nr:hypothetical protein [Defluviitaleaceae bacterium]